MAVTRAQTSYEEMPATMPEHSCDFCCSKILKGVLEVPVYWFMSGGTGSVEHDGHGGPEEG
jgi:hypothetical protein